MYLQDKWSDSLRADGIIPTQLSVMPDVFSPLYWKVQYEYDGACFQAPLAWNGMQTGPWQQQRSADPALLARLSAEDRTARIWAGFSFFPLQDERKWEGGKEYSFYDWRFGSFVPLVRNLRSDTTLFSFRARFDDTDKLVAVRYIASRGDSGWLPPVTPKERSGIYWFIGLDF
jgi:hypothetical protein